MKHIAIIFAGFLFLSIGCNKPGMVHFRNGLWQKLNTPYFGKGLDIEFTSTDTGYILGAKYSDDSIYNILTKTYDGGQTWKTIAYRNHRFLLDTSGGLMGGVYVYPFDSKIIFSGGLNLIRSIDGGLNWQIINPVNQTSFPIYFFDPENGVGLSVFGISTTTDGGITWKKALTNPSINRIQFTTRETGYASFGAIFSGNAGGYFSTGVIYKTNDGGNSWNPLNYPGYSADNKEGPGIFGLNFIDNNTGFIYVINGGENTYSGSEIYKTINGGNDWVTVNSDIIRKLGFVNNFYMSTEKEGFVSSDKGIFHTIDDCKTWQKEYEGAIEQTSFPDSHTGYVIDTSGVVLKRVF